MFTLEISFPGIRIPEDVTQLVGWANLYRKGTDAAWYADVTTRERANLLAANLNALPGIRARILEFTGS